MIKACEEAIRAKEVTPRTSLYQVVMRRAKKVGEKIPKGIEAKKLFRMKYLEVTFCVRRPMDIILWFLK